MLGDNLRAIRKKNKLTLRDLAKIFNLSYSTIGKYERGDLTPDIDILKKYAEYFNISIAYLLDLSSLDVVNANFLTSHSNDFFNKINNLQKNSKEQMLFLQLIKLTNILGEDYLYFNKSVDDGILQNYIDILKLLIKIKAINENAPNNQKDLKKMYYKSEFFDIKTKLINKIDELFDLYLKGL